MIYKVAKHQDLALDVAKTVTQWRNMRGLSQNELALRMGTSQARIAIIEKGERPPTLYFLKRVADALDIKLSISWEDTKE